MSFTYINKPKFTLEAGGFKPLFWSDKKFEIDLNEKHSFAFENVTPPGFCIACNAWL